MGASQARKQVVSDERAPTNEKRGSPAAAFQTHVYLSDILDEKRPAVKEKCPFAIGRLLIEEDLSTPMTAVRSLLLNRLRRGKLPLYVRLCARAT
jgi:hypothetical protein